MHLGQYQAVAARQQVLDRRHLGLDVKDPAQHSERGVGEVKSSKEIRWRSADVSLNQVREVPDRPLQRKTGAIWVAVDSCLHLTVGWMTGRGKRVFVCQAITFLSREHRPEDLRLGLIDPKCAVELAHSGYLPHAGYPLAAAETLERVRSELDRLLREAREGASLERAAAPPSWPRLLVVLDEVAELTCRDLVGDRAARAAQEAASWRLGETARLGRSVGVHLVRCGQRPDAEAVPGQLKVNLQSTVAFRVRAAVPPPHPGRATWQEETMEEFQAVDCSREERR
ncbi:MAG: hypothetical protein M0027_07410 [Candidatus Dormibacteraeota bacterium]|jgi:hypothetical protein|nr:hypothetical protein [Candidatus Dormibacteraeota bacterium]